MVTLELIPLEELKEVISISYLDDGDLFEKYHINPTFTFEECVNSTFDMIVNNGYDRDIKFYKVVFESKSIGYVVVFDGFLYSFGINIEYRGKDILIEWWKKVKEVLPETFVCMLYDNNIRAIDFLKKNGMEIIENELLEDNVVILINN